MKQTKTPHWKIFEHILCDAWRLDHLPQPNMHVMNRLVHNLKQCINDETLVSLYSLFLSDPGLFDDNMRKDITAVNTLLSSYIRQEDKTDIDLELLLWLSRKTDIPKDIYLMILMSHQLLSAADIMWHFQDAVFDFARHMVGLFPNPLFSDYFLVAAELKCQAKIIINGRSTNAKLAGVAALQNLLIRCGVEEDLHELAEPYIRQGVSSNVLGFDLRLVYKFIYAMVETYSNPKGVEDDVS